MPTMFYGDDHFFVGAGLMVDFFFILSGFVMARTYESRMGSELGARRFLIIRARRLWAPIAIGVAIGLFLYLWPRHKRSAPAVYLTALGLLMLPNLVAADPSLSRSTRRNGRSAPN